MYQVTLNAEGAQLLDGELSFWPRDAGSYVAATRIIDSSIAAAVISSPKMKRIDIKDLHGSCAHSNAHNLREMARQIGVKVFQRVGFVFWVFGEGQEDGGSVDDLVSLHQASGTPVRGSIGEAAYVCRRGTIPDDDRRRLFADGMDIFRESRVQRTGGLREGYIRRQCCWCPVEPWIVFDRTGALSLSGRSSLSCWIAVASAASKHPSARQSTTAWSSGR